MHRINTIGTLILLLAIIMAVHGNTFAQDDEESVDRDNSVWSDVIEEQESEVNSSEQQSDASESENEEDSGGFIPSEKINVDSAISFPVDI